MIMISSVPLPSDVSPSRSHVRKDLLIAADDSSAVKPVSDATLLTMTTTTTTVEVKVKTTKTSSRKRKLDEDQAEKQQQQAVPKSKKKQRCSKLDGDDSAAPPDAKNNNNNKSKNSATVDQSSAIDEAAFGSCEPGSSVVLQGIVWNETDKGVLVVNITWRGKTYVGALLNTTEQNWAPPRYKGNRRSSKHHRDHQLTSTAPAQAAAAATAAIQLSSPLSHESTERILRNGKRRGSSATVIPTATTTTRSNSFKIPEAPPTKLDGTTVPISDDQPSSSSLPGSDDEKNPLKSADDETMDNCSSGSSSPSTSSSSPSPLNNPAQPSAPMDLSSLKTIKPEPSRPTERDSLRPYHFTNDMLFPSSYHPSGYFPTVPTAPSPYLHGSNNAFSLAAFHHHNGRHKLSPASSYLPLSPQLYFQSLSASRYPPVSSSSSSSKSSR